MLCKHFGVTKNGKGAALLDVSQTLNVSAAEFVSPPSHYLFHCQTQKPCLTPMSNSTPILHIEFP